MPIYEYTCKSCDARFEKLTKSMSDERERVACPECGSTKTARAMSVFAVSSSAATSKSSTTPPPGMCGRCGGPGPCGMN